MRSGVRRRDFLKISGTAALAAASAMTGCAFPVPAEERSAPVRMSQVGFLPGAYKVATVQWPEGSREAARKFAVHRMGGGKVLEGALSMPGADAISGDRVQIADFSAVRETGKYRLEVEHGQPVEFAVGADGYRHALWATVRGYYGQRCGCHVDMGGGYAHPPCHLHAAFDASSGRVGRVVNHGGWHDAGDYGRYVVNSGISTGTLLWAWELYGGVLHPLRLQIPESGGAVPDFLAEVRWNLNWMLSMQDVDGGVWHKMTSRDFCELVMPQDDPLEIYVIGSGEPPYKVTTATADFTAVMAIAARVYREYDAKFAERCLKAAERGWMWAMAHPDALFVENPKGIFTGVYGDRHDDDELKWASAELWRTTGEARYEDALLKQMRAVPNIEAPGWEDVESMAWWTYVLAERDGKPRVVEQIKKATLVAADALVARSRENGYGHTLEAEDYVWGSNGVAGNQGLLLLIADQFDRQGKYREAALANVNYLLGRNCFGVSWVTQVGTKPFQHPHHNPSLADGIAAPWPGLLSGGPNRHPADPVGKRMKREAPMRMWVDNWEAYSLNEIAINWNAPLVFVLAGALV
ncbi:MAG: glycoside hydrolase family 9 protein [Acidobacteriaceae bacterium]